MAKLTTLLFESRSNIRAAGTSALIALFFAPLMALANPPRILLVSPEQTSILQTGGLAHATTGLARALNEEGYHTEVLMPGYLEMTAGPLEFTGQKIDVDLDWRNGVAHKRSIFSVLRRDSRSDGQAPTLFLSHESRPNELNYFDNRSGGGKAYYAPQIFEGEAFGAFAKAAADYILQSRYDIVILNDWTAGLIATHLAEAKAKGLRVPKVIFAIHNIAYQGVFPRSLAEFLGLDPRHFSIDGYEYYGQMSFLKAGLQWADLIYTVSGQYAKEIATSRFGAGLDGLIRAKSLVGKVTGVLNGILNSEWDPTRKEPGLTTVFSRDDLSGKRRGKIEMQAELQLRADPSIPVFVLTSRLAEQKGFEYLIDAMEHVAAQGKSQWIIMGEGDQRYVEELKRLQARFPDQVRFISPFSSQTEKKLMRYGDFFVNGAWFEPSGLNQLFALRNGTLPVVSAAGGLLESVKNGVTGIHFDIVKGQGDAPYDKQATARAAAAALQKAVRLYANTEKINKMRLNAMAEDHSWHGRVRTQFKRLFEKVMRGESVRTGEFSGGGMCSALFGG